MFPYFYMKISDSNENIVNIKTKDKIRKKKIHIYRNKMSRVDVDH